VSGKNNNLSTVCACLKIAAIGWHTLCNPYFGKRVTFPDDELKWLTETSRVLIQSKEIRMKKIILISLLAVVLVSGLAYAHGNGMGGYGGHMMGGHHGMMGGNYGGYGNCPGAAGFNQNNWNSEKQQQFLDETAGLRKEMHNKRFEYMEAQRNPKTTRAELMDMENEMQEIQEKINEKAQQLQ
jgi:hypothetical protein